MTDTAEVTEVSDIPKEENAPKKSTNPVGRPRKPKPPTWHPKVSVMVEAAIRDLKERRGSSLPAIKKYIDNNYKVDMIRMTHLIKKYLKTAVANGALLQTSGKGASGSFKLKTSGSAKVEKQIKKVTDKKKIPKSKVPKTKKTATTTKKPKPKSKPKPKPKSKLVKAEKKSKNVKSPKKPKSKTVAKPKPKKISKSSTKKTAVKKK